MKVVRQVDRTDCGPACLATVLGYWGREEPLYRLRELAGTTQSGTSLLGLMRAAQRLGVEAKAFEADLEGLATLRLPVILHWEHSHYVVLAHLTLKKARIADPALGLRWIPITELTRKWTGKVLALRPGLAFERGRFMGRRGLSGLMAHLTHFRGSGSTLVELALGTMVLGLLGLGSPLLSQVLFDRVLTFHEETLLPYLLAAIFLLALFQNLFGAVRVHLGNHLSMRLNYRLHLGYFDHLLYLPLRVHETRLTGDLLSRFSDLSRIRSILSNLIVGLPTAFLTLLLSFSLLFTYNAKLALIALTSTPLHALYLLWLSPRLQDNSRKVLRKGAEVQSYFLGSLEGFSMLKALRAESWALMRGRDQISGLNDLSWQGFLLSNWGGASLGLLGSAFGMFLLWYGAGQVLRLELTVGQLVAAYGLVQNALGALSTITSSVATVQEGIVASDRLAEILELEPEPRKLSGELDALRRGLEVEGVRFGYQIDRPTLNGISLSLPKGSCTVLLGPNGAGKSTLALILARMLEPEAGRVLWDGRDLAEVSPHAVRGRIVYVRQEVPLLYASLRDNLAVGQEIPDDKLWAVIEAVGLGQVVRRLPEGLDTTVGGESPFRFSSGEKQMLGLARALLTEADVLVLDEPTATLDLHRERGIVQLLAKLKGQRTLLIITHRPALLELADQVFVLEGGSIQPYKREVQA